MTSLRNAVLAAALLCLFALALSATAQADSRYVAKGFGAGTISGSPTQLAVDEVSGDVLVVDKPTNRVLVFSSGGSPEASQVGEFGAGELSGPFGIAVDQSNGDVYVSDEGNARIVRYETDRAASPTYTLDPSYISPSAGSGAGEVGSFASPLAVDQSNGDLLVADRGNQRISRYTVAGVFVRSFNGSDTTGGPFVNLLGLAVASNGDIYALDLNGSIGEPFGEVNGESRIERFSSIGVTAGSAGTAATAKATAIAYDSERDNLLAATQFGAFGGSPPQLCVLHNGSLVSEAAYEGAVGPANAPSLAVLPGSARTVFALTSQPFSGIFGEVASVQVFNWFQLPELPAPTELTSTTATFSGTVYPTQGVPTKYRFEYRSALDANWSATAEEEAGETEGPVSASHAFTGLEANLEYQVRLVSKNKFGEPASPIVSFKTPASAPLTVTGDTNEVEATSAYLRGSVDPYGMPTRYRFEYGPTAAYGASVPSSGDVAGGGYGSVSVSHKVLDLQSGVVYHYPARRRKRRRQSIRRRSDLHQLRPRPEPRLRAGQPGRQAQCLGDQGQQHGPGHHRGRERDSVRDRKVHLSRRGIHLLPAAGRRPALGGRVEQRDHRPADHGHGPLGGNQVHRHRRGLGRPHPGRGQLERGADSRGDRNGKLRRQRLRQEYPDRGEQPGGRRQRHVGGDQHEPSLLRRLVGPQHGPVRGSRRSASGGHRWEPPGKPERRQQPLRMAGRRRPAPGFGRLRRDPALHDLETSRRPARAAAGLQRRVHGLLLGKSGGTSSVRALPLREEFGHHHARLAPRGQTHGPSHRQPGRRVTRRPLRVIVSHTDEPPVPLTPDAPAANDNAYLYDAETGSLTFVGPDVSSNESTALFPPSSSPAFAYLSFGGAHAVAFHYWHAGVDKEVLPISAGVSFLFTTSPNDRYYVFGAKGTVNGFDPAGSEEIYRYDTVTDELVCASCRSDGKKPTGSAFMGQEEDPLNFDHHSAQTVLDDGTVFFDTPDSLLPSDANGTRDVYAYNNGQLRLISPGDAEARAQIAGVSPDGSNVFFKTTQQLVSVDADQSIDVYDARIGGGFAWQNEPQGAACESEDCRTTYTTPAPFKPLGSEGIQVAGKGSSARKGCPKGRHKVKTRCVKKQKAKPKKQKAKRSQHGRAGKSGRAGR